MSGRNDDQEIAFIDSAINQSLGGIGHDESQSLFMTSDLTIMHYTGYHEDDEVQGILFMYKDLQAVYSLEQVLDRRPENKAK